MSNDVSDRSGADPSGAGRPALDSPGSAGWYDLFSRGARDWLRHNEKVREAVRQHLPQIVAGADVLNGGATTVRVPVRMLEHYRFRLRSSGEQEGVGQGQAKPGDRIGRPQQDGDAQRGVGGNEEGGIQYTLEFRIDDIVDWLWEEMQLPNLEAKAGRASEDDWTREGWDRRGARSRLDRRRSLKESIKRRGAQSALGADSPSFTDDDLRYRQLAKREQPAMQAVVMLLLDVSGSMGERERQISKTFFFWAIQGLRRQYRHLDLVFVAHTSEAWEFQEEEFFRVTGTGGTVASAGLKKVHEIIEERYSPSQYNVYLFYASDGENFPSDQPLAQAALEELSLLCNFSGFLEVAPLAGTTPDSEIGKLFLDLAREDRHVGAYRVSSTDDIWNAVRHFFTRASAESA
jgi:sporulation protein YhbH